VDKGEFAEKAPQYYAVGIAVALIQNKNKGGKTLSDLDSIVETTQYRYFQKPIVVGHATKILLEGGAIEIIEDDFAPTIYKPTQHINKFMADSDIAAFRKFAEVNSWDWIRAAIKSVNDTYDKLKVAPEDFDIAATDSQWEPLPLDREDEKLKAATKAVDDAIKTIEGDNGYAAKVPAEREYVLTRLRAISAAFKERAQIAWPEIKANAIDPLGRVHQEIRTRRSGRCGRRGEKSNHRMVESKLVSIHGLLRSLKR
jgi:hypothetical protein